MGILDSLKKNAPTPEPTSNAAPTRSLFAGIGSAELTAGGAYFDVGKDASGNKVQGHYEVEIKKVIVKEGRPPKREILYIAECTILDTDVASMRVGTSASWVQKMSLDSALGAVKEFIAAALGVEPHTEENRAWIDANVTEEVADASVGPDNPLAGKKVLLTTIPHVTKTGGDFTKHRWSAHPDMME